MASQPKTVIDSPALEVVLPLLKRDEDPRPIAVMTCGISGAGKSTLAKSIIRHLPHFTRLSADDYVYKTHGLYKIDYPAEKYEEYLDEGQEYIRKEVVRLLKNGQDVVLDLSFWNKEYREEYYALVDGAGGRRVLVHLDADKDVLWNRVQSRRATRDVEGRDGDCAYDVEEETFDMYCNGFEAPNGEGEVRVVVT